MSPARDITTTQTGADGPGAAGGQHAMMGPLIAGGTVATAEVIRRDLRLALQALARISRAVGHDIDIDALAPPRVEVSVRIDPPDHVRVGTKLFARDKVEAFKNAWGAGDAPDACAAILGIARGSLHYFAKRLGAPPRPPHVGRVARVWTAMEEAELRQAAGVVPHRELVKRYRVARRTLIAKLAEMGLSGKRAPRAGKPTIAKAPRTLPKGWRARKKPTPAAVPAEIRGDVPVRRFEMGASGLGNDMFLRDCGYEVKAHGNGTYEVRKAGAPGRAKKLTRAKLIELLDAERSKRGLEPVAKR
jgi:hypothetical protein